MTKNFYTVKDRDYLKSILNTKTMIKVWRKEVRQKMREQGVKDMYDYYDFNYNIERNSEVLYNLVINGEYRPSTPLIYSLEKKYGVSRHMVIPSPSDSLLLQILSNKMSPHIFGNRPSQNAYFSRDRSSVTKSWKTDTSYGIWIYQWIKMQKKIYHFQKIFKYIVVTDIADYYDNIDFTLLRQNLLRLIAEPEVLVNLTMKIVEYLSWRPYYSHNSGRILPTANLDSIRLLAFSNLFHIDGILDSETDSNFVRWMDDIAFGVNDKEEGKRILSLISDKLKINGFSLNLSKTNILSSQVAIKEFMFKENEEIDNLKKTISKGRVSKTVTNKAKKMWSSIISNQNRKNWDKAAKRIIELFSDLGYKGFLNELSDYYIECPVLRDSIIRYLEKMGYSKNSSSTILQIITKMETRDDIALFQIIHLLTDWKISIGKVSYKFLRDVDIFLKKHFRLRESPYDFYCYLWFKSKYSGPKDLVKFIKDTSYIWNKYSFLRRQVISVLPRLYRYQKNWVRNLLRQEKNGGDINTASVALQIEYFTEIDKMDNKLKFYIFPDKVPKIYPLPKFLVLCSVLNSSSLKYRANLPLKIRDQISDPHYLKWIGYYFR